MNRTLSGSEEDHHHTGRGERMRHRSYSQNDSAEYARRMESGETGIDGPRRMSLTEVLLGRRSLINSKVFDQTLQEESSSLESLNQIDDKKDDDREDKEIGQNESSEEFVTEVQSNGQNGDSVFLNDENSESTSEKVVTREITQTDHLNKRLLDSFLTRINNFTLGNPTGATNKGEGGNDPEPGRDSPKDYSTLYTDDFLLDHIYRKLHQKK